MPVWPVVASVTPGPFRELFHWEGQVQSHLGDVRGPRYFSEPADWGAASSSLYRVIYVWRIPPAANPTIDWYLDGSLSFSHTPTGGIGISDIGIWPGTYSGERVTAVVSSVDSVAFDLTAYLWLYLTL